MPIYATLIAKQGNPDIKLSIINDMSLPMKDWEEYVKKPLFKSEQTFGADIIYLNPDDTVFAETCGSSCILLITVYNSNKMVNLDAHYTLTVTRDIMELTENS